MAVFDALRESPSALLRNPVVLIPVILLAALQLPQLALQAVNPLLGAVASLVVSVGIVFVVPFFQGGIVAMADEALDGRTSLDTFLDAGKSNYLSIFGAYLALLGINLALGIVTVVASAFVGTGVLAMAQGGSSGAGGIGVLAILGIVAAGFLVYLLVAFFLQFYGHAIVLDDLGAVDGLKRSAARVRHNPLATFGYMLLSGVVGGGVGLLFGVLSLLTTPGATAGAGIDVPIAAVVAVAVLAVAATGVVGAFLGIFSVAVYRRLSIPAGT
ncbi:DUF7847 domain-containing protein [Haloparvum sedimenti]|uniref:DUF7847 domain-containing protein n=1 Tax=Haloparvum sedimenti TaxID=1678448 RepID=UPI00071E6C36|nr:hypothetical protein [Haloparvum sedimenti]